MDIKTKHEIIDMKAHLNAERDEKLMNLKLNYVVAKHELMATHNDEKEKITNEYRDIYQTRKTNIINSQETSKIEESD